MPEQSTQPRRGSRARPTVESVTANPTGATEDTGGAEAAAGPGAPTGGQGEAPGRSPALPPLPTAKTATAGILETKTVVLYGQAGIGKSTMASEWAGGNMLFFDCAGELADLEVYRMPVTDWTGFRAACAAYAKEMTGDSPRFKGCVIDTADMLGTFCAQAIRKRLGIAHESDADWGKGWTMVREEFASHIAKLAALPGGVILVSHAKGVEIKKRNEVYDRQVPTLTGGVRDACINAADLVLYIDYDEDGDNRVIYSKPGKYHEAKERGRHPRLPAAINWPVDQSGYETLRAAWYADTGKE